MKIFLDTADVDLIGQYYGTGLIDGVTTNPTLIKKSGQDPEEVYRQIALLGVDDISMEIVTDDSYESSVTISILISSTPRSAICL